MKARLFLVTTLTALMSSPAWAIPKPAPGPEAGAGIGAMALVVSGYLFLRRRMGR